MAELLEKYYSAELILIGHHLARVADGFPVKDIHRVRVGIKKIRAVHRMLSSSFPEKYSAKSLNRPYKKVFRSFGRFREVQINLALLKKHGRSRKFRSSYLEYLGQDLDLMKGDMLNAISSFNAEHIDIDISGELAGIDSYIEIEILQAYIAKQRERAVKLLSDSISNEELHSLRILLKNIKPFLKLLVKDDRSVFSRKDFKRLNRTESKIGNWHDRIMLAEALKPFIENSPERAVVLKNYAKITRRLSRRDNRPHMARLLRSVSGCLWSLDRSGSGHQSL